MSVLYVLVPPNTTDTFLPRNIFHKIDMPFLENTPRFTYSSNIPSFFDNICANIAPHMTIFHYYIVPCFFARFMNNFLGLTCDSCLCTRDHPHTILRGAGANGICWTKIAEPYPHAVASLLALASCQHAAWTPGKVDVVTTSKIAIARRNATGKF